MSLYRTLSAIPCIDSSVNLPNVCQTNFGFARTYMYLGHTFTLIKSLNNNNILLIKLILETIAALY